MKSAELEAQTLFAQSQSFKTSFNKTIFTCRIQLGVIYHFKWMRSCRNIRRREASVSNVTILGKTEKRDKVTGLSVEHIMQKHTDRAFTTSSQHFGVVNLAISGHDDTQQVTLAHTTTLTLRVAHCYTPCECQQSASSECKYLSR